MRAAARSARRPTGSRWSSRAERFPGVTPMAAAEACDFHGLPAVRWQGRDGATAIATLQGAHLVSWVPAQGGERLFVSERSPFEPGRAIRGGVPVCFPQFADRGPLPQHGFARVLPWKFAGAEETHGGTA